MIGKLFSEFPDKRQDQSEPENYSMADLFEQNIDKLKRTLWEFVNIFYFCSFIEILNDYVCELREFSELFSHAKYFRAK